MNGDTPLAQSAGSDMLGYAALGKTALALVLVLAAILLCAALARRWAPGALRSSHRQLLKVVSSVAVGQRERVVIVEVEERWLVLGVANGQVNLLQDLPAGAQPSAPGTADNRFSSQLRRALGKDPHP